MYDQPLARALLPHPMLDLSQYVRIVDGEYCGVTGHIIACEWDYDHNDWIYYVKDNEVEFGPFTTSELWQA